MSLFDGMIFVAATALALALLRSSRGALAYQQPLWHPDPLFERASPFLAAWTLAIFVAGLRYGKQELRRLARCPGWVGCAAASTILVLMGAFVAATVFPPSDIPMSDWFPAWHSVICTNATAIICRCSFLVGPAVVGAWLALAVSGARAPRGGWLSAFGRVLAVCWVAVSLFLVARVAWGFRGDLKNQVRWMAGFVPQRLPSPRVVPEVVRPWPTPP
jgi:hypothetical protein